MTIRQRTLLMLVLLGDAAIIETIVLSCHMKDGIPLGIVLAVTVLSGYIVGALEWKWKRDKEMAGIVAERLMGKMHGSSTSQAMSPNAQIAQQANSLGGGFNSLASGNSQGILSSILGLK
jgi:hypothetical protein